jgi:hypothetical protein
LDPEEALKARALFEERMAFAQEVEQNLAQERSAFLSA